MDAMQGGLPWACVQVYHVGSMFEIIFQTGYFFFRFELNFQISKLALRFQINSKGFSRDRSFGH